MPNPSIILEMENIALESVRVARQSARSATNPPNLVFNSTLSRLSKLINRIFMWRDFSSFYGITDFSQIVNHNVYIVVRGPKGYHEKRYKVTPLDVIEYLVLYTLLHDKNARQYFIDEYLDILEKVSVKVGEKEYFLPEYAKLRGVSWRDLRAHVREEAENLFETLALEFKALEEGTKGKLNNQYQGDKLALYLYLRETMMNVKDIRRNIMQVAVSSVAHNIAFLITLSIPPNNLLKADRQVMNQKMIENLVTFPDVPAEVENLMMADRLDYLNYFRDRLNIDVKKLDKLYSLMDSLMKATKPETPVIDIELEHTRMAMKSRGQESRQPLPQ